MLLVLTGRTVDQVDCYNEIRKTESRSFERLSCDALDRSAILRPEVESDVGRLPHAVRVFSDIYSGELPQDIGFQFRIGAIAFQHYELPFLVDHKAYNDLAGHIGSFEQGISDVPAQSTIQLPLHFGGVDIIHIGGDVRSGWHSNRLSSAGVTKCEHGCENEKRAGDGGFHCEGVCYGLCTYDGPTHAAVTWISGDHDGRFDGGDERMSSDRTFRPLALIQCEKGSTTDAEIVAQAQVESTVATRRLSSHLEPCLIASHQL